MNKLEIDKRHLERELSKHKKRLALLSGVEVNRAQAAALTKTARLAKTQSIRESYKPLAVTQKLLRPRVKVTSAKAKNMTAEIFGGMRGIPLIKLKAKEVDGGVQAGPYLVPDGFIATPTSFPKQHRSGRKSPSSGVIKGGAQVFKRKGRGAYPLENQMVNVKPVLEKKMKAAARSKMRMDMRRLLLHELKHRIFRKMAAM